MSGLRCFAANPTCEPSGGSMGSVHKLNGASAAWPEITLVTVVPGVPSHAANYLGHDVLAGYYHEQADAVLQPALATLRAAGIEATPLFRKGHAAEVIGKMADAEGFELLLMGSHGHSALRGLVLGSVVAGVLARCQVPLLIVR